MLILKILWWCIKWCCIVGIPILIVLNIICGCLSYKDHNKFVTQKRAFITFEEFKKLYPVSADKWYFTTTLRSCDRVNSTRIYFDSEYSFRLFFLPNEKDNRSWISGECVLTQMIFKTYRDFDKYYKWLKQRDKAIRNHKTFEQQKADIESMNEVLHSIQKDIDKAKNEANKQIEKGTKTTIEVAKRIENDSIYDLFYKNENGQWEGRG